MCASNDNMTSHLSNTFGILIEQSLMQFACKAVFLTDKGNPSLLNTILRIAIVLSAKDIQQIAIETLSNNFGDERVPNTSLV